MSRLSFKAKIMLLVFFPITLLVISGVVSIYSLKTQETKFEHISRDLVPIKTLSAQIDSLVKDSIASLYNGTLNFANEESRKREIERARTNLEKARESQMLLVDRLKDEDLKKQFDLFSAGLDEYEAFMSTVLDQLEVGSEEAATEARTLMTSSELSRVTDIVRGGLEGLLKQSNEELDQGVRAMEQLGRQTTWLVSSFSVVGTLICIIFAFINVRSTISYLSKVKENMVRTSQSSKETSDALTENSSTVSRATSSAAAAVEECSASMEEILSMIKLNTKSSSEASQMAVASFSSAENGREKMSRLAENIKSLTVSSEKIRGIVDVIDDLSFQTNLLALNASVEAARAGEAGRGFAVVADAVRSLAGKSAQSAKEISDLIAKVSEQVGTSLTVAKESEEALAQIFESSAGVRDIVDRIAVASREQELGLDQIAKAITALDTSIQENSKTVQQVTLTSEQMAEQAGALNQEVVQFEQFFEGKKAA